MEIAFTKGAERTYTATALRQDGVLLQVPGGDRKFPLPHDIAHFVVEHGLGLRQGFWGRVARGAVYPGMKVLLGRLPLHAADRSRAVIKEEEQQGVEAEVLVGTLLKIMHDGLENDWHAAQRVLKEEWRPSKPERDPPSAEEVRRICTELREAERQWQALEAGQSLTYRWLLDRGASRRDARQSVRR